MFIGHHRTIAVAGALLALISGAAPSSASVLGGDIASPSTMSASTSLWLESPKGWVAYQRQSWVRLVHPDGTGDHILTQAPGAGQEHPDWSPDGRRLVMDVDFQTLWVVDVDSRGQSTGARPIYACESPCVFIQDGAWSPDGTEVAFLRYSQSPSDPERAAPSEVVGVKVNTGELRVIYTSPNAAAIGFSPRWSPDATKLVLDEATFATDRLDETDLIGEGAVIVTADGQSTRRQLTDPSSFISGVDWGPNGRIVTSQGGNLWTMKPDGSQRRKITANDDVSRHAIQPTWTRSGALVFTYVRGQFGIDDRPTLGLVGRSGRPLAVWSADAPTVTHPRVQPPRR